jgi:hypothetical protein
MFGVFINAIFMTKKRSAKKGHGQKYLSEWNESFLVRGCTSEEGLGGTRDFISIVYNLYFYSIRRKIDTGAVKMSLDNKP